MWSIDACRFFASSLLSAVFVVAGGWLSAYGQPLPAALSQPDEALEYHLHKGESLADIARVFQLSPDDLARFCRKVDNNSLLSTISGIFLAQAFQYMV